MNEEFEGFNYLARLAIADIKSLDTKDPRFIQRLTTHKNMIQDHIIHWYRTPG